jgi:excisionase family DNA binding protein
MFDNHEGRRKKLIEIKPEAPEPLLDTEWVCNYLKISPSKLSNLIRDKQIAAHRIGGEYRFKREYVDDYLARTLTTNQTNQQDKNAP